MLIVMYEVVLKDGSRCVSKDELQAFADHFRKEGAVVGKPKRYK